MLDSLGEGAGRISDLSESCVRGMSVVVSISKSKSSPLVVSSLDCAPLGLERRPLGIGLPPDAADPGDGVGMAIGMSAGLVVIPTPPLGRFGSGSMGEGDGPAVG
jgi:hypothetical protein